MASADAAGMDAVAFKAQQEGISLLEAEKAIEEENKSRPATTEGAIITVEEEFEVRKRRPLTFRGPYAVDATRLRQTRPGVVSFSILRPFRAGIHPRS